MAANARNPRIGLPVNHVPNKIHNARPSPCQDKHGQPHRQPARWGYVPRHWLQNLLAMLSSAVVAGSRAHEPKRHNTAVPAFRLRAATSTNRRPTPTAPAFRRNRRTGARSPEVAGNRGGDMKAKQKLPNSAAHPRCHARHRHGHRLLDHPLRERGEVSPITAATKHATPSSSTGNKATHVSG